MIAKHKYLVLFIISCIATIAILSTWYSDKITRFEGEIGAQKERVDSLNSELLWMLQLTGVDNNFISGEYDIAKTEYQRILNSLPSDHPLHVTVDMRLARISSIENASNSESNVKDIETMQLALMQRDEIIELLNNALDSLTTVHTNERDKLAQQIKEQEIELTQRLKEIHRKEKIQVISFKSQKGKLIHYLGEVKDGKASGGGVGIWSTGSIYKGEWKENLRHGQGKYQWADGDVYEGTYVNDIREGEGVYHWTSGEHYDGEWSGDKRNGYGKLFDKDNNLTFEGQWRNDKIVE
jgi:hypothetical protein